MHWDARLTGWPDGLAGVPWRAERALANNGDLRVVLRACLEVAPSQQVAARSRTRRPERDKLLANLPFARRALRNAASSPIVHESGHDVLSAGGDPTRLLITNGVDGMGARKGLRRHTR